MGEEQQSCYKDSDWLRREYCEKNRTAADIAEEVGVSKHTIYRYAQKFDLTNPQQGSVEVSCGRCGEKFSKPRSRYEEDSSHYCSSDCFHAAMSDGEIDTHPDGKDGKLVNCEWCDKEVYKGPTRLEKSDHYFCSEECFQKAQNDGFSIWGASKEIECEWCGKVVEKKLSELEGHENKFCSPDCQKKWQGRNKKEFECKVCGDTFQWSPSRTKDNNPTYCSIECRNKDDEWIKQTSAAANKALQKMQGPTTIEKTGYSILDNLNVDYKRQEIVGEKFCVDALVENGIVIEWDGNYWHGHPSEEPLDERQIKRKRIDQSKNAYLTECGFTVVRVWGSDLQERPEKVQELLKKVVGGEQRHKSGEYLIKTNDD